MKPTEQFANAAVMPKTGRFATLRGLPRAQGSCALACSLIAAPLLSLCVLLALCVGVAQAEPPKLISYGSLSAHGMAAGVAVEDSGDLFVSGLIGEGFGPSTVVKLDPSGNVALAAVPVWVCALLGCCGEPDERRRVRAR